MSIVIRKLEISDIVPCIKLFHDTVHSINSKDYTLEQVNVWAPAKIDPQGDRWKSLLTNISLVAELNGKLVGFIDITHTGYLDRLFVHKEYQRMGVATSLLHQIEYIAREEEIRVITTEASITAKPFFETNGYIALREQRKLFNNVELVNYLMRKELKLNHQISFRPLDYSDIPLIHHWFNLPHVQKFYSLRSWTESEIVNKFKPYIDGSQPLVGFIVLINNRPIGYIQKYKVSNYPWPNQNLSDDITNHAAGIDLFIGDETFIGKGIGSELIQLFIDNYIWPNYRYCIIDPDINNIAAIKCYEKLNFYEHTIVHSKDALDRPITLKLMILKRQDKIK